MIHRTGGENLSFSWLYDLVVCGGWVFTKTPSICIHGEHDKHWQFVSEVGLNKDRSFKVNQDCDQPSQAGNTR